MHATQLLILVMVFCLTSIVSVVTGSTSLVTVPVMIECGIEPHLAVATNMCALIFLSAGGLTPLRRSEGLQRSHLSLNIVLTIVGSISGAVLLTRAPAHSLQIIIAMAMIGVAVFSVAIPDLGTALPESAVPKAHAVIGYSLTLVLAVYGGFFSGGYVTLLTAVFTAFFHMTFLESIAATKLMNTFSSVVATLVFAWRGIVDFKLGLLLGVSAFVGGLLGARIALKLNAEWLRRIFIIAVFALAARMLSAVMWR
jgi:uncharacterized protein